MLQCTPIDIYVCIPVEAALCDSLLPDVARPRPFRLCYCAYIYPIPGKATCP